jgi:hypothetical protein
MFLLRYGFDWSLDASGSFLNLGINHSRVCSAISQRNFTNRVQIRKWALRIPEFRVTGLRCCTLGLAARPFGQFQLLLVVHLRGNNQVQDL